MTFTRRAFFACGGAALAGIGFVSPRVRLEAISAPRLPHSLTISGVAPAPFFEIRSYRAALPANLDQLHRAFAARRFAGCGIDMRLWERRSKSTNLRYLFAFDSLRARADAWTSLASHPAWMELRDVVAVTEISVYQLLP